jgi:hypothetical protein
MNKKLSSVFLLITLVIFGFSLVLNNSHPHLSSNLTMLALLLNALILGVDIILDKYKAKIAQD